ncbi:MAG: N-acetylmuramoyl-L-alanine amidase [Paracoccaceae bacterium]
MVVIHYTALATTQQAVERLCDPQAEVSAHYLIAEDGQLLRLVAEQHRAWHAGAGAWGGSMDVNSRSIGIELTNDGQTPFAARQIDRLERLLADIMTRWDIPVQGVIAHSDMAPTRKSDPGARFDWRRLALAGLSVWPEPNADEHVDFAAAARRFGYPDAEPEAVLAAFRLRFRPWAKGPADATDRAMIGDLAARYPVDRAPASA